MALLFLSQLASSGAGTFDAQVAAGDGTFRSIVADEVIEILAPAPIRVKIDSITGWDTDDLRQIHATTDFGERYTFESHSDADIPTTLQKLGGSTAGLYPGMICGHAARGYDMSGNKVLTAGYTGGPGPTGTMDIPVTVTVSDSTSSDSVSFTLRLIHPDVYYADADKTLASSAPETIRRGTIYVSRDGDFTGLPSPRNPTATLGGIAHLTLSDGKFSVFSFRSSTLGWTGVETTPECVQILFKSGETYFPQRSFSPLNHKQNTTTGTWYPSGQTARAKLRADDILTFSPSTEPAPDRKGLIQSNLASFGLYTGWRFVDLDMIVSDYDPSDVTWREWWNVLKYTGKTGTIAQNNNPSLPNYNGDILTNGAGVYTQVIQDDGIDTLLVRQIVTNVDTTGAVTQTQIDAPEVVVSSFTDGDTLTGPNGSVTFVAAGSRQDRVRKTPQACFNFLDTGGVLIDHCLISGGAVGVTGLRGNCVISDTVIKNCWNYGNAYTAGTNKTDMSEIGVVINQPLGYEGLFRFFGTGETVSGNRNFFNVYYTTQSNENLIEAHIPATNDVSHSMRRFALFGDYSQHYCGGRWFGGHGGAAQPLHRMGTDGDTGEGNAAMQIYGCFYAGGGALFQMTVANQAPPYTPKFFRIESSHFQADFSTGSQIILSEYSNYALRNCILEYPEKDNTFGGATELRFFGGAYGGPYKDRVTKDPIADAVVDANAVDPIHEFCTFVAKSTNSTALDVIPNSDVRTSTLIERNNAWAIDAATVAAIDAGIAALNDNPDTFYAADFKPLSTAKAYQSATGFVPKTDAEGTTRGTASKGALEPSA